MFRHLYTTVLKSKNNKRALQTSNRGIHLTYKLVTYFKCRSYAAAHGASLMWTSTNRNRWRGVCCGIPPAPVLSLSLSLSLSFEAAENIFFVTSNKTKEDDGRPRRGANVSQSGIHSEIDKITDFG